MDPKGEELAAVIAEIRDRVRARNINGGGARDIAPPDLTPLLHARDAAEGKVASIGTVNPRPPGLINSVTQSVKRLIARSLDWHVREQVEFNRAVMTCVQATLEILNENNRNLAALSSLREEARQLKDIRARWSEWHVHWEKTLANTEIQFLRSIAELQASFQHRVTLMDANYRDEVKAQHANFEGALAQATENIQKRVWEDFHRIRAEYDAMIHSELRLLRQRTSLVRPPVTATQSAPAETFDIDWLKFAEKFRGSEAAVRERQHIYAGRFRDHAPVLDLGCGRGEMMEVFREAGIFARGIDSYDDCIALCLSKGLDAEKADLFTYLAALPDASLGGAVCCQVVEHLPPARVGEMIRLLRDKLRPGGLVAIETPNPECLAIFATHFYIDPTHRHPIPPSLLCFYLEESGLGDLEVQRLSPAVGSMPALAALPEAVRDQFFGALDYVAFATRLS
jgi:2-polyprenyl-3-methyl-5-hydroxy-6-metoxy-1,4-benzoquinol methylase